MNEPLTMLVQRDGDSVRLLAPEVGTFTGALAHGRVLASGEPAGVIEQLGRRFDLVVPTGVNGVVTSLAPERVHQPVGYGDVLYELAPLAAADRGRAANASSDVRSATNTSGLTLRSPQSGRFYHRPAPGEPDFVAVGDIVEDGKPVGLIEVMKTFTHVVYRASNGLPLRARIVRIAAPDGGEVRAGDVVLELEAV